MTTQSDTTTIRTRRLPLLLIGVGAVAAVAALGLWLFFGGDTPDEVSLDAAIESLDDSDTESPAETTVAAADADNSVGDGAAVLDGEWFIDTETGDFDYETASGSFVGFRIEEELRNVGSTTAVGRTGDITGSLTIEGTTVTAAAFEVDLTTITTETSNRDDNVQDALETGTFPTATFELTEPIDLGADAASAEAVTTTATGSLTIHGVTRTVTFEMDAQLVDDVIVAVGSTTMLFSDYGVEVPSGGPVITVDDFGVVELQFLLRR
ncbi:MAG: YceI family protein [Actinomycetota bacterium]